jgi:DNA-binding transcriptional LysR family regulator
LASPFSSATGRRVRLTPAAHGLVARVNRALAELDLAEAELAAEHLTVRGRVVVGAFPSAALGLVIPAALELAERHPELSLAVRENEPEDGIGLLRGGELDLLVSESYDNADTAPTGGLEPHPLWREPLLLAVPASEPRRRARVAGRVRGRGVDRRAHRHAVRSCRRASLPRGRLRTPDRPPRGRGSGH